ncbi:MAG: DUF1016 N-terminal domain-containing protein [Zoogloeaceae bacterium]|jgi:hypothetical protein|nr:DUF1016 N-terminal domain-containing protein [Zoogloeaceae bacterium]
MSKVARGAAYQELLEQISHTYTAGRGAALQSVNTQLVQTYWQVGQQIVEFEQGGRDRAGYGAALIKRLSADLRLRHGKGFSRSNLISMRQFYLLYSKGQKPSGFLSWSHYVELIRMDDSLERNFYEQQAGEA